VPRGGVPVAEAAMPGKKLRLSNMELLRLLSMLLVLVVHADYMSLGAPNRAALLNHPFTASMRIGVEHAAIVCVNVFVLISGWFGIRPKWKGLAGLLFQVTFFPVLIVLCFLVAGVPGTGRYVGHLFCPGYDYWFVVAYLGLYLLSPVLNAFAEHASQRKMEVFLLGFFALEVVYGWLQELGNFIDGYSMISFAGLYLLARYLRLYPGRWSGKRGRTYLLFYGLAVLLSWLMALLVVYVSGRSKGFLIAYNSPFIIFGSMCLMLAFTRLRLQSRLINRLAASSFAIYLVHCHPLLFNRYKALFSYLYERFNGISYVLMVLLCLLAVGAGCLLLDQLRILCWKGLLRLRERCRAGDSASLGQ